jgi:excisionase family DNA binding protein
MHTVMTFPIVGRRVVRQLPTPVRQTYTVEEAAQLLGISRSHAYACARSGELPALRFRGRIVIPKGAIRQFLDSQHH